MRKLAVIAVLCVVSLSLGAQMKVPTSPSPAKKTPLAASGARSNNPANFPRISIEDAQKLFASGQAVFIDVRSNEQYTLGHIKGALSIPGSQLIRRFSEVPPRKTIITYCACSAEQSSGRAAADLIAHGVKDVFALKGGWNDWKNDGHPTAVGAK
ncbi:MAG: rhodanese-like domain-containing protein [Thermoanaerobaculia bacterium]